MSAKPISSPYNFVPLWDSVFTPEWTHQVSHDTPFSDGLSGEIRLLLTTKTPLYLRNCGKFPKREDWRKLEAANSSEYEKLRSKYLDFYRIGWETGSYAIPSTAIKGMIGEVLSIASCGALRTAPELEVKTQSKVKKCLSKLLPSHYLNKNPDLAETIFGFVNLEVCGQMQSLRGRVSFDHFIIKDESTKVLDVIHTTLDSPKPETSYQNYLREDEKPNGWKRFPIRRDGYEPQPPAPPKRKNGTVNEDMAVSFRPLPANTMFEGAVRFFNLRPVELGALLWAITWGKDRGCRHSLGMAKPYGYGSVLLEILDETSGVALEQVGNQQEHDLNGCLKKYEETMSDKQHGWKNSPQLNELKAMARADHQPITETLLEYPSFSFNKPDNEFELARAANLRLLPFTELCKQNTTIAEPITLIIGEQYEGIITTVYEKRALANLGQSSAVKCILPISEVADCYVTNIKDYILEGQTVHLKVIGTSKRGDGFVVSLKQASRK